MWTQISFLSIGLVLGLGAAWALGPLRGGPPGAGAAQPTPKTVAASNPETAPATNPPKRIGAVIGVKPEKLEEYIKLHADTWPAVLQLIRECNIRNYSIYLGKLDDGNLYLFAYYEYVGNDFDADMKKMAASSVMHDWWKLTDPCQIPQKNRKPGEHWMTMQEVFHTD